MCGIAGRAAGEAGGRVDPGTVARMGQRLAHRGPDGQGLYDGGGAVLAHRRLAIIDRAGGAQPLQGCSDRVWVTYNGELYEHALLRAELEARGHAFRTRSDTEVLVHGWEEWGEALPERLRGMFAFALWDGRSETLFLARDRLGKKPLYWARAGQDLVFASEAKALFAQPGLRAELDPAQLGAYLALRYVPGPQTLLRGVQRLQPGWRLSFRRGELRAGPYWDVPLRLPAEPRLCEQEQVERFTQLFEEAVRLRLLAEVPVGVLLSGGLDSSAVAWAMRQHSPGPVRSYAVGYPGDREGELAYARLVADHLGLEHTEVLLGPERFAELLPLVAWHLDEPVADAACLPLFELARRAREEVVVALSGEGADEVLAGYPGYPRQLWLERAWALGPALQLASAFLGRATKDEKVRKYLGWARQPLERRYLGVSRAFADEALLAELTRGLPGPSAPERLGPHHARSRGLSPLQRLLYLDTKVWLPDDLLLKADKVTMASALELRTPFLDHELLALCWSLPDALRLRGGTGKYLLRRAMADKLPPEILTRRKQGFPVPTSAWLRGPLHAPLREALLASRSACRALLPAEPLRRLLEEHRTGAADRTEELFALWMLEAWHQAHCREQGSGDGEQGVTGCG